MKLAVTKDKQTKGYGTILLVDAIQKTLHVSHTMGIARLFVDAKDEAAKKVLSSIWFYSPALCRKRLITW